MKNRVANRFAPLRVLNVLDLTLCSFHASIIPLALTVVNNKMHARSLFFRFFSARLDALLRDCLSLFRGETAEALVWVFRSPAFSPEGDRVRVFAHTAIVPLTVTVCQPLSRPNLS